MAISNDLNSIRTHLEDDYTALEQLGVSIEDRNIENIKDMANQIYNKFPKTDYEEGSNITLSNTLKGKLDFEDDIVGYGDTLQEGEPTPTTPIPIQVVTGTQEVVVRGKNLANIGNVVEGYVSGADGSIVSSSTNNEGTIAFIKVKPSTAYTFKIFETSWASFGTSNWFAFAQFTTNNTSGFISRTTSSSSSQDYFTITTSSTTQYVSISARGLLSATKVQLEENNQATTYEPYQTPQTYQLSLGNKQLYEDCYIVGTPDNWKFVDNWYRLSSSEFSNLTISTSGSNKQFVVTKSNFIGVPTPKPGKIYCTHLKYNSSVWYTEGYCGIVTPGATLWIYMTEDFQSVDAFKTFITTNNMEIVYQTEQPIETPITDTTLINQLNAWYYSQSFTGTTIIEINGNLPLIIKVRALKGE